MYENRSMIYIGMSRGVSSQWQDILERLDSVLSVIYLVFIEGYSASSGERATRADLSLAKTKKN